MKKRKSLLAILSIVLFCLILFLLPRYHSIKAEKNLKQYEFLTTFNQLLIPESYSFYLEHYAFCRDPKYSLDLIKGFDSVDEFGNNKMEEIEHKLIDDKFVIPGYTLEELDIYPQSFYKSDENNTKKSLSKGKYVYYLSFKEITDLKTTFEIIKPYMEDEKYNCDLLWIPIETSNNDEDICIGLRGNFKADFTPTGDNNYLQKFLNNGDFYQSEEEKFEKQLNTLDENKDLIDDILISYQRIKIDSDDEEIYNGNINLNIDERKKYISGNGIKALGLVLYANENLMDQNLQSYFNLIKVNSNKR